MGWLDTISSYITIRSNSAAKSTNKAGTVAAEVSSVPSGATGVTDTVVLSKQAIPPSIAAKLEKTIPSISDPAAYTDNANQLLSELRSLPQEKQAAVKNYLRQEFYHALRNNDLLNSAAYGALLDAEIMLPVTPEEKALIRSFTTKLLDAKTSKFINEFVKSKKYTWTMDGVAYVDGKIPGNKLSCLAFTFEYLRAMFGSGTIQAVGRGRTINLAEKTAEDLPAMFDTNLAKPITITSNDDLANTIINDVNRDGKAYYLCQAYNRVSVQIEGEEPIVELSPKHALIIVGAKAANGEVNAIVIESSPIGDNRPRAVSLAEKFKHTRYDKFTMTNIMPDDPADQVSIVLQGISGKNLPKKKTHQ